MKLFPEFKAKWVAALRSGKYIQGFRKLETLHKKFCCLGVACVVAEAPRVHIGAFIYYGTTTNRGSRESNVIPESAWKEITAEPYRCGNIFIPIYLTDSEKLTRCLATPPRQGAWLSCLNDSGLFTFDEIADLIEERL